MALGHSALGLLYAATYGCYMCEIGISRNSEHVSHFCCHVVRDLLDSCRFDIIIGLDVGICYVMRFLLRHF